MAALIGKGVNLDNKSSCLRRPIPASGPMLTFLLLFGLAPNAWSQQTHSPAPSVAIANAALPDGPEAQIPVQTPTPQPPDQQPSPASVRGVVVDRNGAVYQGVRVTLGQSITPLLSVISDTDGRFQFVRIPPGPFTLTVSSEGFTTQVASGLLHPGESYEAPPIVLSFATATSEVQVTASRIEVAEAQLKDEEQQRVFGVIPNFYVVYAPNAPPLDAKQKFHLAWRSSIDPVTFLATGLFAGIEQANDTFHGYGQGAQGYAKRYGANYADGFISTMIGGAILPSLLKQDPRYFYKGTGTTRSRILYAISTAVICKGDNGHWQPNYSGILGGLAAGGISNLYYPASDRNGLSLTFENTLIGFAGSAAQNLFQEFLVRKLTPKLPNYGASKP
jgi:hypothetical protein